MFAISCGKWLIFHHTRTTKMPKVVKPLNFNQVDKAKPKQEMETHAKTMELASQVEDVNFTVVPVQAL